MFVDKDNMVAVDRPAGNAANDKSFSLDSKLDNPVLLPEAV